MILGVILLVLTAAAGVLNGLAHQLTIGGIGGAAGLLVFGLTGVVVAYHQPRNPVGWILTLFALLFLLGTAAQGYAVLRYHLDHSGLPLGPAAVLIAPVTALSFFVLPLAILLFPDGQLTALAVGAVGLRGLRRFRGAQRIRPGGGRGGGARHPRQLVGRRRDHR